MTTTINKPPKYYANVRTPRGTSFVNNIPGNNASNLKVCIRAVARKNRQYRTAICWFVWRVDNDKIVSHGVINEDGTDCQLYDLVGTTHHP